MTESSLGFSDLGLADLLLRALKTEGYTQPTPIQQKAIPSVLQGKDLLGLAQTGTGKTAAFALPILQRLLENHVRPQPGTVRALVLAPTRELAAQIAASFKSYGKFSNLSVGMVFGGVSMGPQIEMLRRGLDILVATPGRLLDHMENRRLRLDHTHIVVFDEADHMLDLGFIVPIRRIVSKLPKVRQTLFFSATMPSEISGLANEILHHPVRVEAAPVATTAERINQHVYLVDGGGKRDLLLELATNPAVTRALVFTRTKRGADKVAKILDEAGVSSGAIHGNKSQNHRQRTLDAFKGGRTRILVATDIAARGIDVDGVSHVFNFELPEVPESYVHRIGRTARAGREGVAISLCDNGERAYLRAIEKLTRQEIPSTDRRDPARKNDPGEPRPTRGPRHGGRPQKSAAPKAFGDRGRPQGQHPQGPRAGKAGAGKGFGARPHGGAQGRPARAPSRQNGM